MTDLVGGVAAAGHGLLVGCSGGGSLTRAQLTDVLVIANAGLDEERQMPRDWLPGTVRSSVQLSRAASTAARGAFDVLRVPRTVGPDGLLPEWTARVQLARKRDTTGTDLGDDLRSRVVLRADLVPEPDGTERLVVIASVPDLETALRVDFEERVSSTRYVSSQVTAWFGNLLHDKLGAVRYGGQGNWYVPSESADRATALYTALMMTGWGTNWVHPALPLATVKELSVGLAIAMEREVANVTRDLAVDRAAARKEGKPDISRARAEHYVLRYNAVAAKAHEWVHRIGDEGRDGVLAHVADALVELDALLAQESEPAPQ